MPQHPHLLHRGSRGSCRCVSVFHNKTEARWGGRERPLEMVALYLWRSQLAQVSLQVPVGQVDMAVRLGLQTPC